MDNISKKTPIDVCADISSIVLFVFPILTDLLGFVSLFVDKLQIWINTNLGTVSCIAIIAVVNVVLIANIIFIFERHSKKRIDKASDLAKGYDHLLEVYADYLLAFEEKCEKIKTTEELYDEVSKALKAIVDEVKDVLSDVTKEKIRVCIKNFPEKYAHNDVTRMELITFCRSDKTLRESALERRNRVYVSQNTDFKLIMLDTYPYFAFNGLTSFEKVTKTPYENSTPKWEKKYNATIVYPIGKCNGYANGKSKYEVLGFLCADTLSTKAFSAEVGPICISFIASISYLLYIFLDKCITYREKIEKSHTHKEEECTVVG